MIKNNFIFRIFSHERLFIYTVLHQNRNNWKWIFKTNYCTSFHCSSCHWIVWTNLWQVNFDPSIEKKNFLDSHNFETYAADDPPSHKKRLSHAFISCRQMTSRMKTLIKWIYFQMSQEKLNLRSSELHCYISLYRWLEPNQNILKTEPSQMNLVLARYFFLTF